MMWLTEILLGPIFTTSLIALSTLFLYLWYSTRNHGYWKKKNVPFVKPYPIIGTLTSQLFSPLHVIESERHRNLGPIYGHFEGSRPVLSVIDTTLLRDIFVKDFQIFPNRRDFRTGYALTDNMIGNLRGEDWKRVRTILTPTFTTGKLKKMVAIFEDCSKTVIENFKAASRNGPINFKKIYGAYTMDVIASSAFSTKLDSHNDPENKFVLKARGFFSQDFVWRSFIFIIAPWFMRFFRIPVFSPSRMEFFHSVVLQIIEERKKMGQTRNDFLQLLMDTAKEQNIDNIEDNETDDIVSNYAENETDSQIFKITTKKSLSMDELVAQCIIFFLAGYETTAITLSMISYYLALHQDIQERLYQEIDREIKEQNGKLTYEALQRMKYLDNIISETLRLCPPATRLERECDADYKLPNYDITIPKGMIITIPNYVIQRDPKHFPDPEKFDPDRFNPEERAKRDPYSYLPFGFGPRNCVGMRFALIEIKICLALVIATFKIKTCSKTKVPPELVRSTGFYQPKEILLEVELRSEPN